MSPVQNSDAANLRFAPEINDAFEIGLKYNGRRFSFNAAMFHQPFDDFQLNTFNGTVFIVQNVNSCDEDLDGADQDQSAVTGACDGRCPVRRDFARHRAGNVLTVRCATFS